MSTTPAKLIPLTPAQQKLIAGGPKGSGGSSGPSGCTHGSYNNGRPCR